MKIKFKPLFGGLLLLVQTPLALFAQNDWVAHSGELWATAFGVNTYLTVGNYGIVFTSPDAVTWTQQKSGTDQTLIDVVFAKDNFVAVGTGGSILSSRNGLAWKKADSGTKAALSGVVFGKDTFVAIGAAGTILRSADAFKWTGSSSTAAQDLNGIAFNGELFVAVGADGVLLSSNDGANWTPRDSGTTNTLIRITSGNGRFAAVGIGGTVTTSTDGLGWTARTVGTGNFISAITFGHDTFVATDAGNTLSDGFQILTSPDALTWTAVTNRPIDLAPIDYLEGINFINGTFVGVGFANVIWTSPDASTWTLRCGTTFSRLRGVAYGNGTFSAIGDFGAALTSPDGKKWSRRDIVGDPVLRAVTFAKSQFVAVSQTGDVFTSPSGVSWTERPTGSASRLSRIAFGNERFVASGVSGTILTSADAITWFKQSAGINVNLNGVAFGGGTYVIVGNNGAIITSPDGEAWTAGSSGVTSTLIGLTYGNRIFVASGLDGTILSSPDGITWTLQRSGTGESITDVVYLNGGFVAVGLTPGAPSGLILTSPDGVNWTEESAGIYAEITSVAFGLNTYAAVGQNGTLLSASGPLSMILAPVPALPNFEVHTGAYISTKDGLNSHPSIALGDFNRDGIIDVAAGSTTGVTINLRNAAEVLQANQDYPVGGAVDHLVVADFNEDGKLDLLADSWQSVGNSGFQPRSFGLLLGVGDGTFQPYAKIGTTTDSDLALAVGDFNSDQHTDIAVVEVDSGQVSVLLGDGHGAFQLKSRPSVPGQAVAIAVADCDQDGIQDLVVTFSKAGSTTGSMTVFPGKGDGTFQPARTSAIGFGPIPGTLIVNDFNGDGIPDVATAVTATGNPVKVGISLGMGDGTFRKELNFDAGSPGSISAADLNEDGILDLIVADGQTAGSDVSVLLGRGDGTFAPRTKVHIASGLRNSIVTAIDLNQDGRTDLAVLGVLSGGSASRLYLNTARERTAAPTGVFQLTLQSVAGSTNLVEVTSDLQIWSPIYTNSSPTGILQFQDKPPTGTPQRFYRFRME